MESYTYNDLPGVPCSAYIRTYVRASDITHKDYAGTIWNAGVLTVYWVTELEAADKILLDGIVDDSVDKCPVVKHRETIMSEILTLASPDPEQLSRLLDALDSYPSIPVALDSFNYVLAQSRVMKAFNDGAITEADKDLVLSCIPESGFQLEE